MRRMPGSVYTLPVPAILSSQILNTKNQRNVYFRCTDLSTTNCVYINDFFCKQREIGEKMGQYPDQSLLNPLVNNPEK